MTRRYFKLSPKTKRFTVRCLTIAFFLFKKIIGAIISVIFFLTMVITCCLCSPFYLIIYLMGSSKDEY
ncbi:hypothetical protein Mucpa_5852 [Mucilaginibacter paludis DSM 18603]|uniref:Uncharacterized protein n=1 Tax=Mucilaginibacter paludis DSM 18603 TaxID=714943 RepID=H1Y7S3_9SPHI|nr:hypothetical protein Mucpa_5852 [Mucilaginibacter paludis DSM 18603]